MQKKEIYSQKELEKILWELSDEFKTCKIKRPLDCQACQCCEHEKDEYCTCFVEEITYAPEICVFDSDDNMFRALAVRLAYICLGGFKLQRVFYYPHGTSGYVVKESLKELIQAETGDE